MLASGQDAELAAKAADIAIALARHEPLPKASAATSNGRKAVPGYFLDPIAVTRANMADRVVADGFQKMQEVYRDVPKDRWPRPEKP